MELTNYMYMTIIAAVIFTGAGYVLANMALHYPQIVSDTGGLTQNSSMALRNFTEMNTNLTETIDIASTQALTFTQSDNPLTAAFGYLLGLFNAIVTLQKVPSIMLNVVGAIMEALGIFVPSWMLGSAILLVITGFLISILYYISKVK